MSVVISDGTVQPASATYRVPAKVLHWLVGLLIIGMLILGYVMINITKGTPGRAFYFNLHKSIGVTVAMLVLLRLVWRLTHRAPALPALPRWQTVSAQWSHRILYLCMVVQPVSGYLSSSFNKYGVKFFGLALPQWGWNDPFLRDLFGNIHYVAGALFSALVLVHVLAALKHLLVDHDGVFERMWRG